jgi:hypothetical protein
MKEMSYLSIRSIQQKDLSFLSAQLLFGSKTAQKKLDTVEPRGHTDRRQPRLMRLLTPAFE